MLGQMDRQTDGHRTISSTLLRILCGSANNVLIVQAYNTVDLYPIRLKNYADLVKTKDGLANKQIRGKNKSVLSFVRRLTTWHCSQLLPSAGPAAIDRYPNN